jgi:hypothetical protein
MTNSPSQLTDVVPTYLGGGDPAGRFTDYYPGATAAAVGFSPIARPRRLRDLGR